MHKSGFVNIIGNPNVGKSTLLNALVGERLSIITSKAQTTRHRIFGIVSGEDFQVIFSDTPGIIKPAYELQTSMMDFVKDAFEDADILIYMVEIGEKDLKDEEFFKKINNAKVPVLVLVNKIDRSDEVTVKEALTYWQEKVPKGEVYAISALENLTDKPERFFVNETIREKILLNYKKEVPYSVEVETETFSESEDIIRIRSIIMVERDSQKGIIIGHRGEALKRVGVQARYDLEKFFGKKIHLELYVKVNKNWRSDLKQLRRFGYTN